MVLGLLIGAAGAALLEMVYRTISSEWPEAYASARTLWESQARRRPIPYLIFRTLPTFTVALLAFVTSDRLSLPLWPTAIAFTVVYMLIRPVRGLVDAARGYDARGPALLLMQVCNFLLFLGTSFVALWSSDDLAFLVPQPTEVVFALWTAVFVAVAGVGLRSVWRTEPLSSSDCIEAARADCGEDLWETIALEAARTQCDPALMQAIVAAEISQRPRWVRNMERMVHRFTRRGTYGVAQMSSESPVSDEESIRLLCESFAGYEPVEDPIGNLDSVALRKRLREHNSNGWFLKRVPALYFYLKSAIFRKDVQE